MLCLKKISLLFYLWISCCLAYAETTKFPLIWNIQNSNEYFVGRGLILKQIDQSFAADNKQIIAIVGSAGIGKTQVAKKYAENYRQNYDIVWWLDSEKNLDDQYKKFANDWNRINPQKELQINLYLPSEEIINQLKDRLRITTLNWLLVFDNVADKDQIVGYLIQKHNSNSYGHILITSKNPIPWSNIMTLDKFTRAESIDLIIKITDENNDIKNANDLAETLKDYPLAITQAASYIKSHSPVNIVEYKNIFLTQRKELWEEESKSHNRYVVFDGYEFTVFTTLSLITKKIKQESPAAFELLVFCSLLDSKNIPKALLKQYMSSVNNLSDLEQVNAISTLIKYSLITYNKADKNTAVNETSSKEVINGLGSTFTMHETIQLAVFDILNESDKKRYIESALATEAKFFPDKLDNLVSLASRYSFLVPNLKALTSIAVRSGVFNNDLITLYIRELEFYLSSKRDFKTSAVLIDEIEQYIPKVSNIQNLTMCRFHLMKCVLYYWRDVDCKRAIHEAEMALSLLKDKDKHEEEFLMSYNRLAQLYNYLGDQENALKYASIGEELINKTKDYLGNKDAFYYCLAKIYMDKGQFLEAQHYINKAIDEVHSYEGSLTPGGMPPFLMEVEILIRAKEYSKAYTKINKLYKLAKDIFPNDNPFFANIIIFKAYISYFNEKGLNYKDEKENIIKGQNVIKSLSSDNYFKSRTAALSHKFLGEIYERESEDIKAQAEYYTALQIYQNNYGSDQITTDDFSDLYTKLAIINVKLQDNATAQQYLDLHRKNFGHGHPRTTEITQYMIDNGMSVGY